jgi:amino acid transporter
VPEQPRLDKGTVEQRIPIRGRHPGDRYVRVVVPREFRHAAGHYVATEEAIRSAGALGRAFAAARRVLFGRPLATEAEITERLSKTTGLAVLGSDNISSSAYATEEAMRVLALAGVGALALTTPIALAVVGVLAVVVLSQLQVIRAYPNGGGSYVVSRENLGRLPGLVAAAAILVDYVLTVAVSTAAGVAAISSFMPAVYDARVEVGLAFIGLLVLGNLRGIREAGMVFAVPTYVYIVALAGLIGFGLIRILSGDIPAAATPAHPFPPEGLQVLTVLLVLRAFASGSVGLTGAEAISDSVPSLKPPETKNASITLLLMAVTFAAIFLGLTFLARTIGVVPDESEQQTLNSLVTRSLVGETWPYYFVQVATAIILALAANTGFTGFPRLAYILANDRFMPRHFAERGERLAFSFGIVALALLAGGVLVAFDGRVTALIPLYTIGVFLAFTLSQAGLVRRWLRLRPRGWQGTVAINGLGAAVTAIVLLITAVTKFQHGAWIVFLVLPLIVLLLSWINGHYQAAQDALVLEDPRAGIPTIQRPVVLVPVARLDRAAVRALAFARAISEDVRAVHIATGSESAAQFRRRWAALNTEVPLDVIASPYRSLVAPLLKYIDATSRRDRPTTVVLAEFIPRHWWEWLLHSQTALRLKAALLFRPDTIVIDVPYHHRAAPEEDAVTSAGPRGLGSTRS